VERVVKVLPHPHFTVTSLYSGWMPFFIDVNLSLGRGEYRDDVTRFQ
jgi:hypothetical protein